MLKNHAIGGQTIDSSVVRCEKLPVSWALGPGEKCLATLQSFLRSAMARRSFAFTCLRAVMSWKVTRTLRSGCPGNDRGRA